ncbi:hypothetical protein ACDX78_13550 [Virgibacillus oceani]
MNEERLEEMREILKIQGYDGNWNHDPYMHGMYNGMEIMLAMVEGRSPEYRIAPSRWTVDDPAPKLGRSLK